MCSNIPALPGGLQQPFIVTDLWLERCLYQKQLIPPSAHILHRPFFDSPIKGIKAPLLPRPLLTNSRLRGYHVVDHSISRYRSIACLEDSAIDGYDSLQYRVSHTTNCELGAKFSEDLTLDTTVLVCYEVDQPSSKRSFACEHGITTVSADWLWDCIRKGKLLSYEKYLTQPLVLNQEAVKSAVCGSHTARKAGDEGKATTRIKRKDSGIIAPNAGHRISLELAGSTSAGKRHSSTTSYADSSFGVDSDTTVTNASPRAPQEPKPASSTTPCLKAVPLQPISANASPKPSPSPPKLSTQQPPQANPMQEDPLSSLGPAISSLLAHHQRAASNASERPPLARRRRQLLGRALSNLSARSFSRASSVDTMNTDGLGTPLEPSNQSLRASQTANGKKLKATKDPFATLKAYAEEAEQAESEEGKDVQLTQLGYEDPDVKAWRDRVVRKMGGGEELKESQPRRRVEDVSLGKTKGIAGRTRAAAR